mmetsp:Transcript_35912/g.86767  ORF Transcript_35912/g.86767 Transcript_35912/m.86767 type:complete len:121 (+) Transcript_35912:309-671(+)
MIGQNVKMNTAVRFRTSWRNIILVSLVSSLTNAILEGMMLDMASWLHQANCQQKSYQQIWRSYQLEQACHLLYAIAANKIELSSIQLNSARCDGEQSTKVTALNTNSFVIFSQKLHHSSA